MTAEITTTSPIEITTAPVRVTRVTIQNIRGIREAVLDFTGKSMLVVSGSNGSGKSSLIQAIADTLIGAGGHDSSLIRRECTCTHSPFDHQPISESAVGENVLISGGRCNLCECGHCEEVAALTGRVFVELSNRATIEKTITLEASTLDIRKPGGGKVKREKEFLESLVASFAFDPLEFCKTDAKSKKKRVEWLMSAMPIEFSPDELLDAGVPKELAKSAVTLDGLAMIRKDIYDKRTDANRECKSVEGFISTLEQGLVGVDLDAPTDSVAKKLASLKASLAQLEADETAEIADVKQQAETARTKAGGAYDAARSDAENVYKEAVAAAALIRDAAIQAAITTRNAKVEKTNADAARVMEEIRKGNEPERTRLNQEIGAAEGDLKRVGQIEAFSKQLKEQQAILEVKSRYAASLDRAVKEIDLMKQRKLASLPIPGLEMLDGEVYYNQISFDAMNEAERLKQSVAIGALKLGDLWLMICDGGERLDEANLRLLEGIAKEKQIQLLITRVDKGGLRSEPSGALRVAA